MTEAEEFNSQQAKFVTEVDYEDIEFMLESEEFELWLKKSESSRGRKRTKATQFCTIRLVKSAFVGMEGYLSVERLTEYKRAMWDNDKSPNTINVRLSAVAVYTRYLAEKYKNKNILRINIKGVNQQPKQYIENVISRADYEFLVKEAKKKKNPNLYLGIKIMGTTGLRISELLQVKVEHIKHGYVDVLGKGAKRRRIYSRRMQEKNLWSF